jgi:hypothetical protein
MNKTGHCVRAALDKLAFRIGALAIMLALALTWCSCEDEGDDVSEIFVDKKFKITGCVYNGVNVNGEETKKFYSNPYYIDFKSGAFVAELANGRKLSGGWTADGDSREMRFDIRQNEGEDDVLSRKVYEIMKNIRNYSGDANVIKLYKDGNNLLILNANFDFN